LSALDAVAPGHVDGAGSDSRPDERLHVALALLALSAGGGDPAVGVTDLGARGLATRAALARARRLCAESLPSTESDRRLFLDRHRRDWPLALAVGSAVSSSDTTNEPTSTLPLAASELWKTAAANPGLVQGAPPLLDGHQVGRILGLAPGPALGEALRALGRAQALGQIGTPGEAEEFLRKRGSKPAPTREVENGSTSATTADAD
jgi:hypothetical protein